MEPPEARLKVDGCEVLLLGTIAGFVPDGKRVRRAYEDRGADLVALGLPPEDLGGLDALRDEPDLPMPEADPQTERLFEHLQRFGKTRIPSPDLEAAHGAARDDGVPVVALDLDDEAHSELYIRIVGFRHAVASGRLLRKVLKADFSEHGDPYSLATAWDAFQIQRKPLQMVEAAREDHMARRLCKEAEGRGAVLAVVPVARFAGVVRRLEAQAVAAGGLGASK